MSDDELEERSDDEEPPANEPEVAGIQFTFLNCCNIIIELLGLDESEDKSEASHSRKRARTADPTATSRFWYPWPDSITCTLDILMHLPRSVFSHRQLDLFLWLLKVNNVDDVPSVKSMQTLNLALQKICGIESIAYDGALGHKYYVNSLAQLIAQEMANPKVRPHLHFYPEDSGPKLSEARQGQRWLKELPDDRTTPMVRMSGKDYYIHEPAMLASGECVVPTRWFTKDSQLYAKCWKMQVVTKPDSTGWRVLQSQDYTVPASDFLKDFITLQNDAVRYGLPHPSWIVDVVDLATMTSKPWKYTNPVLGNRWRAKAEGHRVVAFPLWMYCDDTSGNVSKKWNEHNSFLMTPAGLPREESHKEFNIHFLCTSNLARPLEMLDGIVEQLEEAQDEGIWAWDMLEEEPVLVIPEVLALLGDNPMQSEFACHIGLRGKFFCRACWVKGTDAMDKDDDDRDSPGDDAANSEHAVKSFMKAGQSHLSVTARTDFISLLLKVGRLRHKGETTEKLRSYFTEASTLNTKTKVKNLQTENGIKDKYQTHFIEQLFTSYKGKRGVQAKQAALNAKKSNMPPITISPVWRIKGLDPHQDTPVEILHVILLGFVKYLWRDLVQLQLKTKHAKKDLLATRLSSFDVSGLGISPLAGRTLVQYSGSLTGRDFRSIAQVAPFVVHDLVSADCLKTWEALSKIIPLIWQPEIENIDSHATLLTDEIEHFLLCAARWTNRWFNKPKFHIFVHLPDHIRRFGPAILFATEAFESFNAIIRAKSVHSNRHAPSRDIAYAFAQGNRIRHLLSGGLFMLKTQIPASETPSAQIPSSTPSTLPPSLTRNPSTRTPESRQSDWTSVGAEPQSLIASHSTVTTYLGLEQKKITACGKIQDTLSGAHIPAWSTKPGLFQTSKSLSLHNGDICLPGNFVIVRNPQALGETFVARAEEIIQQTGSVAAFSSGPDGILLQRAFINPTRTRYGMPSIQLLNQCDIIYQDLLCTVNVQHNCIDNKCGPTGTRPVFQERAKTTLMRSEIVHSRNPHDIVLNTAQMRDAVHMQRFRVHSEALDFDTVVHQSAAKELKARKAGDPVPSELLASGSRLTSAVLSVPFPSTSSQPRAAPRRVSALQRE
ncbi:hypothetical protein C8R44DRAFT_633975 [Mycena epipterygia]|nr:hypothetical protein C8R44DRAFT_633975 [Mycena epipterygia]